MDRRSFLKAAGAASVVAVAGRAEPAEKVVAQGAGPARGMAKGLTLLTFREGGELRLGVKTAKGVLDVRRAAALLKRPAPGTLDDLLQREEGPALEALVAAALGSAAAAKAFLDEATLQHGPLLSHPEKIVCVGHNYRRHVAEVGAPVPKEPVLFSKFNTALNAHGGTVKLPVEIATKFDYEVELVIVMGRECRRVAEADALSYVAGYATGNDFTARDLQYERGGQWIAGKTPDGFAPLGPYLVTADQVDPDDLKIELRVNGETRQSSSTSDFIFSTRQVISYVSKIITLRPGDILFTGTPEGVIQGKPPEKRVWLKAGDKIACSLEKLGELRFELT
jgi:2-keto-4-pentenoate hydratase/2-oxohepta-3-ene-1,7-dioic acid hydratase in catechol pathway